MVRKVDEIITTDKAQNISVCPAYLQDAVRDIQVSTSKTSVEKDTSLANLPKAELSYAAMAGMPVVAILKDTVRTSPSKQPVMILGAYGLVVLGSIVTNKGWQENMQKLVGELTHGTTTILSQIQLPQISMPKIQVRSLQAGLPTIMMSATEADSAKVEATTASQTGGVNDRSNKSDSKTNNPTKECTGGVCEFDPANAPWLKNKPVKEKLQ